MNSRSSDRKIPLGIFGKPFGLKGYLYFRYYGNNPEGLSEFEKIYLSDNNLVIKIEHLNKHNGKLIVKLFGVDNRSKSEVYRDKEVFVFEKHLPSLSEGEFYWYQLEKLLVINEKEELLGMIDHVMETGANDVLVVKPLAESVDDLERLIPFSKNVVIGKIDLLANSLHVKWPREY